MGWEYLQEQLQEQGHNEVPYEYIVQLMDKILHNNIYTFHDALWKQEVGQQWAVGLFHHMPIFFLQEP